MDSAQNNCEVRLAELASMDRNSLVREWRLVFGQPAPRSAQVNLLRGALAWKCQIHADVNDTAKALARHLRSWTANAQIHKLTPGAKLIREWNGCTHQVTVLEKGFDYGGKVYRSLTAITRKITGMSWSGPLFFGLRK